MFTALCLVRKIEKFAVTHVFADVMILITLLTIVVYGAIELADNGNQITKKQEGVYAVNPVTWASSIGFAVYSYEGIGVILPVQDITASPETFHK